MFKSKLFAMLVLSAIILSACAGSMPVPAGNAVQDDVQQVADQGEQPAPVSLEATPTEASHSDAGVNHHSDVDLTHLAVGDGKYSTSPQMGYVYSCMTSFSGGGAQGTGPWMNGDGTWDATKKAVIDGSVTWPGSFTVTVQGDQRVFTGNDLPDHPTGTYPVASSDDAYSYDRNPNSIKEQSITLSLPANPVASAQPNCVGGEVGIMLSGVVIFSAFDAEGRDAAAHEVQDECDGHPQVSGFYHYHTLSDCIEDSASGHSALVGYAFDGYGIYGYYGEDGGEVTNADLDVCHGHTHTIEWDGQMVEMYHYHATHEFPYVVSCFHGEPAVRGLSSGEGRGMNNDQQSGQQGQPPANGQPPQGGQGGQPPQEAFDACIGLTQGAACTVTTPNGTITGACNLPPNSSTQTTTSTQLVCAPLGGLPQP